MQRVRFFTAWDWTFSPGSAQALARLGIPALLVLLLFGASAVILQNPKVAIWDQARLLEARFEAPYYPALPFGFTSQLLVIALRALLPAGAPLHEVLRLVAMAFWAGSAAWLATALLERRALVAVFLILLFTSQYPFLWLSSELITGGFLCLAIGAWLRGASPWIVGPLLASLGLCKMELLLVSGLLLAFWVHTSSSRREGLTLVASFAAALALLLLPGFVLVGPEYWIQYGAEGQGRGIATFRQHFAALVAPFQIGAAPNPWTDSEPYVERVFPGADSMLDVITTSGLPYLDFVALSTARGVRKLGWVFGWAWLAVPLLVWAWRRGGLEPGEREKALLLTFVGCLPFVLFAYPHIRFFARYYPVFWILLFVALERVSHLEDDSVRRPCLRIGGLLVGLALIQNARRTAMGLAAAPHLQQYWFPD
jgi:hypothetical protein